MCFMFVLILASCMVFVSDVWVCLLCCDVVL